MGIFNLLTNNIIAGKVRIKIKQMMIMAGINLRIFTFVAFVAFFCISPMWCLEEESRDARFSIFQIIKFQNAPCIGGTRNGTCFTSAECESAGGTEDGTCADGFGVCCATIIAAGSATALNQSYIVEATPTTGSYTICPCSTDVCRIRFDFTMFTLAAPQTASTMDSVVAAANAANLVAINSGQTIGDCISDQFSISGSAGSGTPIICGTMTGQHVIVDSDGSGCSTVSSSIATAVTLARTLDIMVTQYKCGEEMGGPPGCLQYFTPIINGINQVRSFNFPNQAFGTNVASTVTHLSNQKYTICIRRPAGATAICYIPCTVVAAAGVANMVAAAQSSFGLSISPAAMAQSNVAAACTSDYITIPGGIDNVANANSGAIGGNTRFCGRALATNAAADPGLAGVSICTNSVPFQIGVNFDEDEISGAIGTAIVHEAEDSPGGIIGFCLGFIAQ